MGCAFSKPIEADEETKSNFFKVVNIDQEGNDHLPGEIEVSSECLLLHQKKKQPVSWPIRTLRRYGCDNNIFSFEVGRRCPTGEGVFAFRCDQAEQLSKLLHTNIQRNCSNANAMHDPNLLLEPRAVNVRHFRLESVGSTNSCPRTPVSPPASSIVYDFGSKEIEQNITDKKINDCRESPVTIPNNSCDSPLYMNVGGTGIDNAERSTQNTFICLTKKYGKPFSSSIVITSSENEAAEVESPKDIEYITLELENKSSSPKTPARDNGLPVSYTPIDFNKTRALLQSTKPNIENDIGCTRRTRHDAIFFGVNR